jgi:hypothetical protein
MKIADAFLRNRPHVVHFYISENERGARCPGYGWDAA